MENQKILVLGAGELGMAVIRSLAMHPSYTTGSVSVLIRHPGVPATNPNKQNDLHELASLGICIVYGDLTASSHELTGIFKDYHTIISCTGFVTGAGGFQIKLAQAVLAAGVKVYLPWQFGVDYDIIGRGSAQDLFDEQLEVRDLLRSQNTTSWLIISTGLFTSFLFEPAFGVVDLQKRAICALGGWDTKVTVTTPEDIGKLTAEVIFKDPPIKNSVIYTAGDTISYGELADLLDSLFDSKFLRMEATVPKLIYDLNNTPNDPIKKYRVVFGSGRGVSWDREQSFNYMNEIQTTSIKDWLINGLK